MKSITEKLDDAWDELEVCRIVHTGMSSVDLSGLVKAQEIIKDCMKELENVL